MNKENCALKLVDEIILYYDARSKKHQISVVIRGPDAYMTIKLIGFLGYQLRHFGLSGHWGEVFSIDYQVTVITKYTFNDSEVQIPITARTETF